MRAYMDAALAFIGSGEMRDYLGEVLPRSDDAAWKCAQIVAYAPAPIEKKMPVLELIGGSPDPGTAYDGELFTARADRFARACRVALKERDNGPKGAMFRLECEGDDEEIYPTAFFTEFDAALRALMQEGEGAAEGGDQEGSGYTITKYVPGGSGQLDEHCTWYLDHKGEIWYFDYAFSRQRELKDWEPLLTYLGDLNLPVPFQPGDIVMADCRPYAPPRRVLILEVGDNCDCCCLQALSIGKDGRLHTGAFKHNGFLGHREVSHISGLYRAARWTGEIREAPFALLAPLVRERPAFGTEIWDYFFAQSGKKPQKRYAPTWRELKKGLGL